MSRDNNIRFSDWSLLEGFSRFGSSDSALSIRSFFQGEGVHKRLERIRRAIVWIRKHWKADYPSFMDELRQSFLNSAPDFASDDVISGLRKEWVDRRQPDGSQEGGKGGFEDYTFLKLYTSENGYQQIFSVLNNAFRTDNLSDEEIRLRAAVFLVELLTIELYNLTFTRSVDDKGRWDHSLGFTGIIHRGMCLSSDHLDDFLDLMMKPIKERFWSIPLAFLSCSTSRDKAMEFANPGALADSTRHRVLFRIHVVSLDPDLQKIYTTRFPSCVVTSVCAVDITALSTYPDEQEVILRGPFFQLVNTRKEWTTDGGELYVLDTLVFNTNRDHPSTMELSEEDGDMARALFACLIEIGRSKECVKLAEEYGKPDDVAAYKSLHDEAQERLSRLRMKLQDASQER
ncbi:hypothetical protein AX17_003813 [Amanita inopinata Kibby_2008]|nr:hypothetical protein AX17_003813 [Amanita inopinata Kibby_2008]